MEKVFNSGNFNNFEKFVKEILPSRIHNIKQEIIPKIDNALLRMVGNLSNVEKTSINVFQECKDNVLSVLRCEIVYTVLDFRVPEAPQEAIESDIASLKEAITFDNFEIKNLDIDVTTGRVEIVYSISLEN